jgi:hypothetical protein
MFTGALASRNMELLIRLTDPSQHRALRIWLAHGLPEPDKTADGQTTEEVPKPQILSTVFTTAERDSAAVRVQLPAVADGKELVLDEQWTRRGEIWYFQPVRLRTASETRTGPVRPYVKQKRRGR